jgi:hypothetical protein
LPLAFLAPLEECIVKQFTKLSLVAVAVVACVFSMVTGVHAQSLVMQEDCKNGTCLSKLLPSREVIVVMAESPQPVIVEPCSAVAVSSPSDKPVAPVTPEYQESKPCASSQPVCTKQQGGCYAGRQRVFLRPLHRRCK